MNEKGILYLVATPIGNLEDITLRALKVLKEVDLIAAEDTRHTVKLLNHFEIKKPMTSYHEHNKRTKGEHLIQELLEGKSIALVSDAGTPGISDPGEDMVRLAIENDIPVTVIPGPSAAITGLVLSGMATERFIFEGFLPSNKGKRHEKILSLVKEERTAIIYEAPHKLSSTLKDLYRILGDRRIAMTRELTKKFEQVIRCTLKEAVERYSTHKPRGEFVLILEGVDTQVRVDEESEKWSGISLKEHVDMYIKQGLDKKDATKKVATDRKIPKRDVYNSILEYENKL